MHISKKILIEITVTIIVVSFVIVLLVKRYVYFKPNNRDMYGPHPELNITMNPFEINHVWIAQPIDATPTDTTHTDTKPTDTTHTNKKLPLIIYCQDRIGNISTNQSKIKPLYDAGFSVLMYNYPGYGNRNGVPTQDEFFSTTRKLITDLDRVGYNVSNGEIILWGDGIGCAVALDSAIRFKIPYIIITNYVNCIRSKLPSILFPLKFCFGEFNSELKLENYFGKIIVMDGSIVPTQHISISNSNEIISVIF